VVHYCSLHTCTLQQVGSATTINRKITQYLGKSHKKLQQNCHAVDVGHNCAPFPMHITASGEIHCDGDCHLINNWERTVTWLLNNTSWGPGAIASNASASYALESETPCSIRVGGLQSALNQIIYIRMTEQKLNVFWTQSLDKPLCIIALNNRPILVQIFRRQFSPFFTCFEIEPIQIHGVEEVKTQFMNVCSLFVPENDYSAL